MTSLIKQLGQSIPVVEILFIRQILVLVIIFPAIIKDIDGVFATKVYLYHFIRGFLSVVAMISGFTAVVYLPLAEVTAKEIDKRIVAIEKEARRLIPTSDTATCRRVMGIHLLGDTSEHPLPIPPSL